MANTALNGKPQETASREMKYGTARLILAGAWASFSTLIFGIIILQTVNLRFGGNEGVVWSWASALLAPNLGLIVTFFFADYLRDPRGGVLIINYWRALFIVALNIAFLLLILVLIVAEPFYIRAFTDVVEVSGAWLAPFATIITSSIAVLFVSARPAVS